MASPQSGTHFSSATFTRLPAYPSCPVLCCSSPPVCGGAGTVSRACPPSKSQTPAAEGWEQCALDNQSLLPDRGGESIAVERPSSKFHRRQTHLYSSCARRVCGSLRSGRGNKHEVAAPVQTLEFPWIDWVFALAHSAVALVLIFELSRLVVCWMELRQPLRALDRLPLRRAFRELKGFSWNWLWSLEGGSAQDGYRASSREMEALQHLNLSASGNQSGSRAQNRSPQDSGSISKPLVRHIPPAKSSISSGQRNCCVMWPIIRP